MENAKNQKELPVYCEHCGALMKEWWQPLTSGLVNILIKAIQQVKTTGINRFHATRDLNLTHTEAANFQKLRFHGLVAHADPDNKRNGEWLLTDRAGQFLRGELAVPRKVKTYRNKVIDHSPEVVKINDFRGRIPEFDSTFEFEIHEGKLVVPSPNQPKQANLLNL